MLTSIGHTLVEINKYDIGDLFPNVPTDMTAEEYAAEQAGGSDIVYNGRVYNFTPFTETGLAYELGTCGAEDLFGDDIEQIATWLTDKGTIVTVWQEFMGHSVGPEDNEYYLEIKLLGIADMSKLPLLLG